MWVATAARHASPQRAHHYYLKGRSTHLVALAVHGRAMDGRESSVTLGTRFALPRVRPTSVDVLTWTARERDYHLRCQLVSRIMATLCDTNVAVRAQKRKRDRRK